ncbi:MAG: hypothetical protein ED859_11175 [Desulfuromonadales bacterium]|nr:MAG: hypothetical protein ED859_11175 [Desulfuromonadales bacterium]
MFIASILGLMTFLFRAVFAAIQTAPKATFRAYVYCIQFGGNLRHLKNFVKKKKVLIQLP